MAGNKAWHKSSCNFRWVLPILGYMTTRMLLNVCTVCTCVRVHTYIHICRHMKVYICTCRHSKVCIPTANKHVYALSLSSPKYKCFRHRECALQECLVPASCSGAQGMKGCTLQSSVGILCDFKADAQYYVLYVIVQTCSSALSWDDSHVEQNGNNIAQCNDWQHAIQS